MDGTTRAADHVGADEQPQAVTTVNNELPVAAQAAVSFRTRSMTFEARVTVTPATLLAIGGMVGTILLSTAVLVWTGTSVRRRHPLMAALTR